MQPKTSEQVELMRQGGRMLADTLKLLKKRVKAGVSTQNLADLAALELKKLGGEPAFKGYEGFPDVLCVSLNEEVVHGIPSERQLRDGDLVSLDFGVKYKGLITDAAITLRVGQAGDGRADKLITTTQEALERGISRVRAGARVGDISQAIEEHLRTQGLGVIETLVGHGVGSSLHEPPEIPNFGSSGSGPKLIAGMTIAIEPMATLGGKEVYIDTDGWTVKTSDGSLSAHFEHTVLVTNNGAEILTPWH